MSTQAAEQEQRPPIVIELDLPVEAADEAARTRDTWTQDEAVALARAIAAEYMRAGTEFGFGVGHRVACEEIPRQRLAAAQQPINVNVPPAQIHVIEKSGRSVVQRDAHGYIKAITHEAD